LLPFKISFEIKDGLILDAFPASFIVHLSVVIRPSSSVMVQRLIQRPRQANSDNVDVKELKFDLSCPFAY
jgi:hypothetical protein